MDNRERTAGMVERIAKRIVAIDEEGDGGGFQHMIDTENDLQEELDRAEKAGKKYILVNKFRGYWHIMACKDFIVKAANAHGYPVKKGEEGGFIQSEKNLSHDGTCWVSETAIVSENATVEGDALVYGNARVSGNANIYQSATVGGNAHVWENAQIYGNAILMDSASVYGEAHIIDATLKGFAKVYGDAHVDNHVVLDTGDIIDTGNIIHQPKKGFFDRFSSEKEAGIMERVAMSYLDTAENVKLANELLAAAKMLVNL